MKKVISLLFYFSLIGNSHAAVWVKLLDNNTTKITLDKQSILQKDNLKRAWVKIEYKTPQKNPETVDTQYNSAKLLWHFDCASQKSATSQVFQYLNNELVYSVGIDAKSAEFIEPVPETDVDIAMRYVCKTDKPITPAESKPVVIKPAIEKEKPAPAKPEAANAATPEAKAEEKTASPAVKLPAAKPVSAKVSNASKPGNGKGREHKPHWTYAGKDGPASWGKLSPEFVTCDVGRNQSPINIEETARASLKPLKAIQKFAAKDIVNNGHTVQINFKEGNMLALDNAAFQMKQVHFHSPSENTIRGKSFPLEAHFVHADSKGNLAVIGVMYTEGKANAALAKLWEQLPNEAGEPIELKNRVIPSDLIPENRGYYRFSGSLTTPPCSEGVRWLLIKTPLTASKEQIEAFKRAVNHDNNRPVQPLNGRLIVE
ncbi:carbonic anhydrase [Methylotenera sp.]|uniref:carbonic anhydrase n=1 Tax=Methylotenera sp. TaxID=2051956 RepID=UPI002730ADC5|nr:surface-adhesin E family protein [Methylotenera sp.]MDP2070911.1 carbonic anhydrase family protein [Methylotenera sp.]MDP3005785.1 carbonic anhydrase family protein [Methylotenera sp.]MDP3142152.1 carbonic anhydrase family protein [Methylotenera sp.]